MDWEMLALWVVISIVAMLIDIFTSSILFVWFAIGGIAALVSLIFNATFPVQVITFIIVSVFGLLIGYPFAKKFVKKSVKPFESMEESYIGRKFEAKEDIEYKSKFKVSGVYWTVFNKGGIIKKGDIFVIVGIEGNKLIIKNEKELNKGEVK